MNSVFNKVANIFSKNIGGEFRRNVLITSFGSSLSMVLGFFLTPIIARVYSPNALGEFALFNSIALNLSILATLNYSNAIILSKPREDNIKLIKLNFLLLISFCVLLSLVLLVFPKYFSDLFGLSMNWIIFLPFFIFINCSAQILNSWSMYYKSFKRNAAGKMFSVVGAKSVAVGLGVFMGGAAKYLVLSEALNKVVSIVTLLEKKIITDIKLIEFNFRDIVITAKRYKNYPVYLLPGTWITVTTSQIPIYILANLHTINSVGYYSYASSLLNIPVLMIGNSIASVFIQKASESYLNKSGNLSEITFKLFKKLAMISIVPFAICSAYGDIIFKIFLGNQWVNSGHFASYLSIYFLMLFIYTPISTLFRVLKKENAYLYLNLMRMAGVLLTVWIGSVYDDPNLIVICFSISSTFFLLISLVYILKKLNINNVGQKIFLLLLAILFSFLLAFLSRMGVDSLFQLF